MRGRITKQRIEALPDGATLWDDRLRGFGVRRRGASVAFVLKYTVRGVQTWETIGLWPNTSVAEARTKVEARRGALPNHRQTPAGSTVAEAVSAFHAAHLAHLRSGQQSAYLLQRFVLPAWSDRPIDTITRRDVVDILRPISAAGRITTANRLRAVLGRFFRWCIAEGEVATNPVVGTEKRLGERARARVLTGARRTEVGGMRWAEIVGDTWHIPATRTKSGRPHTVHLTPTAVAQLPTDVRIGPQVFGLGPSGFNNWSRAKVTLDEASGTGGWTLHDIRRTVATRMQALGVLPHVVAAVLNHSQAGLFGVTAIYLRASLEAEKREAWCRWETELLRICQ